MQLKQPPTTQTAENILPLVNVVFLLLIFFMLAGAFSKPDIFKIEAPIAENDNAADRKVLTILMNSEGELALEGSLVSDQELKNIVTSEVNSGAIINLQLKADANVDATRLIDIMENLGDTGLRSLHLLTVSPSLQQ